MIADAAALPATDPIADDYAALLAQGTALVQRLSGLVWTNYNWSDPGVTILQQLCYALTELSYRAGFPVADILGDPTTGRVQLRRQGLYPARAILPVNPVTIGDIRRLIVDRVPEIGNAWVDTLAPEEADGVAGLYRIAVLVPGFDPGCEDHGPDPDHVRCAVERCYAAHRAYCEDLRHVTVLRPIRTRIFAEVQLDDHADPDVVLADILFRIGLALAPEPRRTSLDALRARGQTTAEIFEGPFMLRGFIADDQLTRFPAAIPVEYLLVVMAEVPGVLAVTRLEVAAGAQCYGPGDTIHVPAGHVLWLDAEAASAGDTVQLRHGAARCPERPAQVRRLLARAWAEQRRTYDLWKDYARDYPPPVGRRIDLAAYQSVQQQFPAVYGIGSYGLPGGASVERVAQARQLKGYLMVFDQLMADFFAQLAFVRDLFSQGVGGDKTYAVQSLRGIVPDVAPLIDPDYEQRLEALVAAHDPVIARQNAVLDLLLSLYAERILPPADAACGESIAPPGAALVAAKRALLAKMVPATRDRGRGFDTHRRYDEHRLAIRCRIELALLTANRRRDGAQAVADPAEASFGRLLPPELSAAAAQTFLPVHTEAPGASPDEHPSPLAGHRVAAALLPALADRTRYRMGALAGGGPVILLCQDLEERCWVIGELADAAQAVALTRRLLHAAGGISRLTLVEWVLLRYADAHPPRDGEATPAGHRFSFRISAVLPAGEKDGDTGWRQQTRAIVRANMPAHVMVDMVFLHPRAMRHFDVLHGAWVEALRDAAPARRAKTSALLAAFLDRHCPTEGAPH
ncbi:hypothetical protein [Sphingomonas hengshuiensis]|uniref:Uncharacterized protein n=1 Tax=Sphingomonas hengshuiensis TaxID=1609977 RepID=A0A7U4J8W7_9SPHN|nr:hypothetical protein [Sphingomonas hengshuiensis]AJP72408.1 hypothetical protein TS85_12345 [Sphingomonas hengshuiensis]